MNTYKTPILTAIFRISGFVALAAPLLYWYANVASERYTGRQEVLRELLFAGAIGLWFGLLNFGIAQVVDCIAKTAFTNEQISATLPRILAALEKFDQRMGGSLPLRVSRESQHEERPASAAPAPAQYKEPQRKAARYFCSIDGEQVGPISGDKIRAFARGGKIKLDTPVIREGEDEWKTFADYPELA